MVKTHVHHAIPLDLAAIADFCLRRKVKSLGVFGSVLREDFDPKKSDVDFLVEFLPEADWSYFDIMEMEEDLSALLARPVDIVLKKSVERSSNYLRRKEILGTVKDLYVAM